MSKTSIKKETINKIKIDEKISLKDLSMMDDRWFSAVLDKNNELVHSFLELFLIRKILKLLR